MTTLETGTLAAEAGLKLYNTIHANMQEAMGLKTYAAQLQEISTIMAAINRDLDKKEQATTKIISEAYALSVKGTDKATLVVSTIYEQAKILALVLNEKSPGTNKEKMIATCATFAKFATDIGPLITEAGDALRDASSKLQSAGSSLDNIVSWLKRVQDKYVHDLKAARAKQRAAAYGGALAGILAGPLGLIISYSVAAGVTEGYAIPELEKSFETQRARIQGYIGRFKDMHTTVSSVKAKLDANRKELVQIHAGLNTLGSLAGQSDQIASLPKVYLSTIRTSVNNLVEKSKAYLATLS